jgi:hypothetical protein
MVSIILKDFSESLNYRQAVMSSPIARQYLIEVMAMENYLSVIKGIILFFPASVSAKGLIPAIL